MPAETDLCSAGSPWSRECGITRVLFAFEYGFAHRLPLLVCAFTRIATASTRRGSRPAPAESADMLPRNEIDTLLMIAVRADDLADRGHVAAGYEALLAGLHRAKELQSAGFTWGAELVRSWEMVCNEYAEDYRIGRA